VAPAIVAKMMTHRVFADDDAARGDVSIRAIGDVVAGGVGFVGCVDVMLAVGAWRRPTKSHAASANASNTAISKKFNICEIFRFFFNFFF
jgi:hypothetical protein